MIRTNSHIQYNYAQKKAYEVLLKYSDGVLPIDPFKIVKKINNIELKTYTEENDKEIAVLKEEIDNFGKKLGGKVKYNDLLTI